MLPMIPGLLSTFSGSQSPRSSHCEESPLSRLFRLPFRQADTRTWLLHEIQKVKSPENSIFLLHEGLGWSLAND